jgi:hypothetical protein
MKIKDEQELVEESLIGDMPYDPDPRGHGRPKSKKSESLFERCRLHLDEALKRVALYKSLKKDN